MTASGYNQPKQTKQHILDILGSRVGLIPTVVAAGSIHDPVFLRLLSVAKQIGFQLSVGSQRFT